MQRDICQKITQILSSKFILGRVLCTLEHILQIDRLLYQMIMISKLLKKVWLVTLQVQYHRHTEVTNSIFIYLIFQLNFKNYISYIFTCNYTYYIFILWMCELYWKKYDNTRSCWFTSVVIRSIQENINLYIMILVASFWLHSLRIDLKELTFIKYTNRILTYWFSTIVLHKLLISNYQLFFFNNSFLLYSKKIKF